MKIVSTADPVPQQIIVDDLDYSRMMEHKWYMHKNNRPRARMFLHSIMYDPGTNSIVINPKSTKIAQQIPADRFILRITHYTNIKIVHPPGGALYNINGDQLECRRPFMSKEQRDVAYPIYIGTKQITNGKWYAYDDMDGFVSDAFEQQESAARAYDLYVVKKYPLRARTNFYYNL